MFNHLLLYRSLTRAQRASAVLVNKGIQNRIVRAPKSVSGEGCGHSIRLSQGSLHHALTLLKPLGLEPGRVFVSVDDKDYEEVLF